MLHQDFYKHMWQRIHNLWLFWAKYIERQWSWDDSQTRLKAISDMSLNFASGFWPNYHFIHVLSLRRKEITSVKRDLKFLYPDLLHDKHTSILAPSWQLKPNKILIHYKTSDQRLVRKRSCSVHTHFGKPWNLSTHYSTPQSADFSSVTLFSLRY